MSNIYCNIFRLYTNIYQYSDIYLYMQSGHITATCFDRKTVIIRPIKNILRYNKLSTQWDPISFTVKVKTAYDELLFEPKTLK